MAKFFISGDVPSSKNSKNFSRSKTGKTVLLSSKSTQKWNREASTQFKVIKDNFIKEAEKYGKPYNILFTFVRKTAHLFDFTNKAETVLDQMKRDGLIEDDNITMIKPYFGDPYKDKDNPGVYIEILNPSKIKLR